MRLSLNMRKQRIRATKRARESAEKHHGKDAKACYKMNRLVLVNLDILDEYLETFHIEDEEFYK